MQLYDDDQGRPITFLSKAFYISKRTTLRTLKIGRVFVIEDYFSRVPCTFKTKDEF